MKAQLIKIGAKILSAPPLLRRLRNKKIRGKLVTILCLHRVSDEISPTWPPLPLKVFDRLCSYWSQHYYVTTFNELKEAIHQAKPLLILSFDDGYLDFYEHAWPILKRHGLKANMNIVTSCASEGTVIWTQRLNNAFDVLWQKGVNKEMKLPGVYSLQPGISQAQFVNRSLDVFRYLLTTERTQRKQLIEEMISRFEIDEVQTPHMSWNQIIELSNEGLEIGSHTLTHDSLPTIREISLLQEEIIDSKKIIEEKIGKQINVFAFPNGLYNETIGKIAFEAGYEFLLSVDNDVFSTRSVGQLKVLPRILIYHTGYAENVLNTENFFTTIKSLLK